MSLENATLIGNIANWTLIVCLAGGVIATYLVVQTTNVKEHQWDVAREQGRQRTAELELQTAEANRLAREAELALEKFKAPRTLTLQQQTKLAEKLTRFAGTKFDAGIGPKGDPEPLYILRNIVSALSSAGWVQLAWSGGGETYTEAPMLSVGLTMVTNVIVDVHPDYMAKYGAAAQALADALNAEGIDAIAESRPTTINSDAIHLRIGRKL